MPLDELPERESLRGPILVGYRVVLRHSLKNTSASAES